MCQVPSRSKCTYSPGERRREKDEVVCSWTKGRSFNGVSGSTDVLKVGSVSVRSVVLPPFPFLFTHEEGLLNRSEFVGQNLQCVLWGWIVEDVVLYQGVIRNNGSSDLYIRKATLDNGGVMLVVRRWLLIPLLLRVHRWLSDNILFHSTTVFL